MDYGSYFKFIFALMFVLGLIGVLTVLVRKYGFGVASSEIRKGQDRRLGLVEVLPIDAKRRAVLIRRDDVEHLIVMGPESETVVETNIPARPSFAKMVDDVTTPSEGRGT
ncbi:flagellar biosynthetic protein FliO [Magnetovibrio sp. PR-2]|uniref:flagellar biosynthetic protein FliO n=1 Tax=Magnetovibrio sp. PR-2 TaxID=3120356 RepID=UPI002FCE051C